jgi:hypothetical protein
VKHGHSPAQPEPYQLCTCYDQHGSIRRGRRRIR